MAFHRKEKCFWTAPRNRSSDSTYKLAAAAYNQFTGCSRKYFGTYNEEFNTMPKRSTDRESNYVYG